MTIPELVTTSMYMVGAIILAIALVLALAIALEAENRIGPPLFPSILPVIGLAISTSTLLTGRSLIFVDSNTDNYTNSSVVPHSNPAAATWPLRVATLYILALSFAIIFAFSFRRMRRQTAGQPLMLAFVFFFISNSITNAILGAHPSFLLNRYYALLLFFAAYATSAQGLRILLHFAKLTFFGFTLGSFLLMLIKPDLALQIHYYQGVIGLPVRLWGLAPHANALAPVAIIYLLIEVHDPFRARPLHYFGYAIGLLVAILAQSKTAWIAGVLAVAVIAYYRATPKVKGAWATGRAPYQFALIAFAALSIAALLLLLLVNGSLDRAFDHFIRSRAGEQVLTLSGRQQIWSVALAVWRQNPIFGYGPNVWDSQFRNLIGMNFAFSAHDQFLQSISEGGFVGLLGLLAYVSLLLGYSVKLLRPTRGLSLALVVFILLRCITETPLSTGTLFTPDFLVHIFVFAYFMRARHLLNRETPIDTAERSHPYVDPHNLSAST